MRPITTLLNRLWTSFRSLRTAYQLGAAVLIVVVITVGITLSKKSTVKDAPTEVPVVSVATIGGLAGTATGSSIIGTVKSISEASILAQSAGTVTRVNTRVGAFVSAGYVIASLDNAAQSAAVLQAQGGYDAAIAARNITNIQSGNSATTFEEAKTTIRNLYRSAYTTIDNTLAINVDSYFSRTQNGLPLYTNGGQVAHADQRADQIKASLATWQTDLLNVNTEDPEVLLTKTAAIIQNVSQFLTEISSAANARNTIATPTQLANLVAARAAVDGQLAALSAARDVYNAKKAAALVGSAQTNSTNNTTASADATIKTALGGLRAAQAAYEKTVIRAPISGTVNFMPLHVGDYVTNLMHVATVAQNGSLEIVAYVSGSDRESIAVGTHVSVENTHDGIITSVAPALDPVNRQIEVHIAITKAPELLDGQTVRITLPSEAAVNALVNAKNRKAGVVAQFSLTTASSSNQQLIPLTALKLTPSARIIFSVGSDGRLVAHPVEIGDVHGDRIVITTAVPANLLIVIDARGLSEGEKVVVSTSTAPSTQK